MPSVSHYSLSNREPTRSSVHGHRGKIKKGNAVRETWSCRLRRALDEPPGYVLPAAGRPARAFERQLAAGQLRLPSRPNWGREEQRHITQSRSSCPRAYTMLGVIGRRAGALSFLCTNPTHRPSRWGSSCAAGNAFLRTLARQRFATYGSYRPD